MLIFLVLVFIQESFQYTVVPMGKKKKSTTFLARKYNIA